MSNLLIALPTTYRSNPVIPYAPNGPDDRAHQWDEPTTTLDTPSGLSVVSATQITSAQGVETIPIQYVGLTRSDARAIEQFVEDRAGRYAGFWCPTFQHEFYTVQRNGSSPAGTILVREWGWATSVFPLGAAYRHIFAVRGALRFIGPVTAVRDGSVTDESGAPIWGYDLGAGAGDATTTIDGSGSRYSAIGLRVSRCLWVRFADDAITTEWVHPNLASITLHVVDNSADAP